jgi:4-hydroxy-tetrahydrodipicolinate synthase
MREMIALAHQGDLDAAQRIDERLQPLYRALSVTVNPIPVKAALNLLGHDVGGLRLPLVAAGDDETQVVRAALEEVGVAAAARH